MMTNMKIAVETLRNHCQYQNLKRTGLLVYRETAFLLHVYGEKPGCIMYDIAQSIAILQSIISCHSTSERSTLYIPHAVANLE